jgi:hypothetical protein
MAWLDETIFGDHLDQDNVFWWDVVELNLPGMPSYSPSKPCVYKKRFSDGRFTADVLTYIDDARPTGTSEEECWQTARKYASTCNHYGFQDSPRKCRPPSMTSGAWDGTVIHTCMGQVCVKLTKERWDKTHKMVRDIWQEFSDRQKEVPVEVLGEYSAGGINRKQLERRQGFLVYVAHAYPSLVPYLKGIHLTLDSWRSDRNKDGWKRLRADMEQLRRDGYPEEPMKALSDEAPSLVIPVPRLEQDLRALLALTDPLVTPERAVRSKHLLQVCMGLGMPVEKVLAASYFWMGMWNGSRDHERDFTRQNPPTDKSFKTWSSGLNLLPRPTLVPLLKSSCLQTTMSRSVPTSEVHLLFPSCLT